VVVLLLTAYIVPPVLSVFKTADTDTFPVVEVKACAIDATNPVSVPAVNDGVNVTDTDAGVVPFNIIDAVP
jgi:hypothetical protein